MRRYRRILGLLLLTLHSTALRGVNEVIRLDEKALPVLPPPSCILTASPSNIAMTTTAHIVGPPPSTITLTIPATSTPVDSATLLERDFNIPYNLGSGMICGGGNPKTVGFKNDPGYHVVQNWAPVGPSQSYTAYIASGSASFVANITGPGGNNSCSTSVTTACAPVMTNSVDWTDPTGTYASFPFDSAFFMTNDDPPYCTWSLCQQDGYGNPWPGCCGNRGDMPGCFAPETRIRLGNGRLRRAAQIVAGDLLWNPLRRRPVKVRQVIWGPEKLPLVELGFGDKRLRVTTKHPVGTRDGIKVAAHVTAADFLRGEDGRWHRVQIVGRAPLGSRALVYNFELDTESRDPADHMIEAEGIYAGDYFLQVLLEKGTPP